MPTRQERGLLDFQAQLPEFYKLLAQYWAWSMSGMETMDTLQLRSPVSLDYTYSQIRDAQTTADYFDAKKTIAEVIKYNYIQATGVKQIRASYAAEVLQLSSSWGSLFADVSPAAISISGTQRDPFANQFNADNEQNSGDRLFEGVLATAINVGGEQNPFLQRPVADIQRELITMFEPLLNPEQNRYSYRDIGYMNESLQYIVYHLCHLVLIDTNDLTLENLPNIQASRFPFTNVTSPNYFKQYLKNYVAVKSEVGPLVVSEDAGRAMPTRASLNLPSEPPRFRTSEENTGDAESQSYLFPTGITQIFIENVDFYDYTRLETDVKNKPIKRYYSSADTSRVAYLRRLDRNEYICSGVKELFWRDLPYVIKDKITNDVVRIGSMAPDYKPFFTGNDWAVFETDLLKHIRDTSGANEANSAYNDYTEMRTALLDSQRSGEEGRQSNFETLKEHISNLRVDDYALDTEIARVIERFEKTILRYAASVLYDLEGVSEQNTSFTYQKMEAYGTFGVPDIARTRLQGMLHGCNATTLNSLRDDLNYATEPLGVQQYFSVDSDGVSESTDNVIRHCNVVNEQGLYAQVEVYSGLLEQEMAMLFLGMAYLDKTWYIKRKSVSQGAEGFVQPFKYLVSQLDVQLTLLYSTITKFVWSLEDKERAGLLFYLSHYLPKTSYDSYGQLEPIPKENIRWFNQFITGARLNEDLNPVIRSKRADLNLAGFRRKRGNNFSHGLITLTLDIIFNLGGLRRTWYGNGRTAKDIYERVKAYRQQGIADNSSINAAMFFQSYCMSSYYISYFPSFEELEGNLNEASPDVGNALAFARFTSLALPKNPLNVNKTTHPQTYATMLESEAGFNLLFGLTFVDYFRKYWLESSANYLIQSAFVERRLLLPPVPLRISNEHTYIPPKLGAMGEGFYYVNYAILSDFYIYQEAQHEKRMERAELNNVVWDRRYNDSVGIRSAQVERPEEVVSRKFNDLEFLKMIADAPMSASVGCEFEGNHRSRNRENIAQHFLDNGIDTAVGNRGERDWEKMNVVPDGSVHIPRPNGENFECVCPPIIGEEVLPYIQKALNCLLEMGAQTHATAGFHVHFQIRETDHSRVNDPNVLTLEQRKNLIYNFACMEPWIYACVLPPHRRETMEQWAVPIGPKLKQKMRQFNAATNNAELISEVFERVRYYALNVKASETKPTYEFRFPQANFEYQSAGMVIRLLEKLYQISKHTRLPARGDLKLEQWLGTSLYTYWTNMAIDNNNKDALQNLHSMAFYDKIRKLRFEF